MNGTESRGLRYPESVPEVQELEPLLARVLREVRDAVLADEYTLLIGDDTSGRVPALIVRHVLNRLRADRGLGPLPLVFLPGGGGREADSKGAQRVLDSRTELIQRLVGDGRALLVTDTVYSGGTLTRFAAGLNGIGVDVDFLALLASARFETSVLRPPETSRVFLASVGETPPRIDGAHHIAGVNKFYGPAVRRDAHSQTHAVAGRREGQRVADSLVQQLS